MHIAVFGGSGRVGGRFIEYALAEGHTVRTLVRDPAKLAPRAGLEILAGDVLTPADVERTIAGADAVVSALAAPASTTLATHSRRACGTSSRPCRSLAFAACLAWRAAAS